MSNLLIDQQLVTERQVADILQKSVQSLRNDRCLKKGLPYCKLGRSVRYRIADVEKFIASGRVEPES